MAEKKFITDINLKGNQIKEVLAEKLATAPQSPVAGRFYYDTADNKFKYYNGTAWIAGAEYTAINAAEDSEGQYGVFDELTGTQFKFRVIKAKDNTITVALEGDAIVVGADLSYRSNMPDDLTTPNAIGGLAAGTSAETLKAMEVSEVLDMILFPELNPTVANPSASISLKSGFSANGIYEVGAAAPVNPDNFNTSLNRGNCTVAGQPNKNRAGALNAEGSFIYYGGSTDTQELPSTIQLGTMQYNYHAAYGQGDTLVTSYGNEATHDSKGSSITNPLPAGSVNSGAVNIYGTYPYFCNGQSASASSGVATSSLPTQVTEDTKLPLQKWSDTLVGAMFASEAVTGTRLTFDFPSAKKVTKVEFYNTVSGAWENFAGFSTTSLGNKEVQSQQVAYSRLTTTGALSGALQLRFTVSNA